MRTTLDIPEELMAEAMKELGFKSKTDAVIYSLRELLRRKRLEGLKAMAGKVKINSDTDTARRRPARSKRAS